MQIEKLAEICNSSEVPFRIFLSGSEFEDKIERDAAGKDCIDDSLVEQVIRASAKDRALKPGKDVEEILYSFDLAATGIPFDDVNRARFAIVTSSFSFDGYNITKYAGFISKDVVCDLKALWAPDDERYFEKVRKALEELRAVAEEGLIQRAVDAGCNAVVGLDFDNTLLGERTLCVTAKGNAVTIKRAPDSNTIIVSQQRGPSIGIGLGFITELPFDGGGQRDAVAQAKR